MIPVTSQRVIEVIRDEICNPRLNVAFVCYSLECSTPTLWKCVKSDFNTTPYKLIQNIRVQKILKNTYDYKTGIYDSAKYYGIDATETFFQLIKRKFSKTPCEIEYEIAICENRKLNYLKYYKSLHVDGLFL